MIWLLLIVYQLKHFVADYPLQGSYMLGKFKPYPHFILPLLSHGLVHGVFTFLIALYFKSWETAALLGALDMGIHSVVDWAKANPSIGGKFAALSKAEFVALIADPPMKLTRNTHEPIIVEVSETEAAKMRQSNMYFWWALGADQLAHHLTHYLLIFIILS